jgi:putative ABC transport system ATP-binding protein
MNPLIEMHGIDKHYHLGETEVRALHTVDLQVERGAFVALSGPSGSGKSTLLNICGLIDHCDKGSYLLEGIDITTQNKSSLTRLRRESIGFVFQSFNLVPVMTAYENVEYPLLLSGIPTTQRRERVSEILAHVGLEKFSRHLPDKLSGGQRQRVAIARALVKKPALVVADEPTANLDTVTATQVIDLMHSLGREIGTTFLVATHDERMTSRCERVVSLIDGEVQ